MKMTAAICSEACATGTLLRDRSGSPCRRRLPGERGFHLVFEVDVLAEDVQHEAMADLVPPGEIGEERAVGPDCPLHLTERVAENDARIAQAVRQTERVER